MDIIERLSEAFKGSNIVIVGSLRSILPKGYKRNFLNLMKKANIRWLGLRRHEDLPKYLNCFDVCIMPYKINDWTITCSPGKFYQYLAKGKPIISTALPEVAKYDDEDIVMIASSPEDFVIKVGQALYRASDEKKIEKRRRVARSNTWDNRAKFMLDVIGRYIM